MVAHDSLSQLLTILLKKIDAQEVSYSAFIVVFFWVKYTKVEIESYYLGCNTYKCNIDIIDVAWNINRTYVNLLTGAKRVFCRS